MIFDDFDRICFAILNTILHHAATWSLQEVFQNDHLFVLTQYNVLYFVILMIAGINEV